MRVGIPSFETSGCIPGVMKWMLCRNARDGRFADEGGEQVKSVTAGSSPGIVARLMGLESLPSLRGKMSRTRSANSAESWRSPAVRGEESLRKSQSFREIRPCLRKESEEFLVLSFGDYDEGEALEEKKLVEKKRCRSKSSVSPFLEHFDGSKEGMKDDEIGGRSLSCRKKISFGQGEMEVECSSQNSSPVSVLDLLVDADGDCLASPDSSISEKVLLEVEDECKKAGKYGLYTRDLSEFWAHICLLGEDDMNNADWVKAKIVKSEEAEEIGFVVGEDIFDCLITEAVFDMFHLYGTVY